MMSTPLRRIFLSIITFIFIFHPVLGSLFTYLPGDDDVIASLPDVEFFGSGSPSIVTSIGPNRTSLEVEIKASTAPYELTTNGNYTDRPAPWYFDPGKYLNTMKWFSNRLGRDGVIMINGTIPIFLNTTDNASIVQRIRWPTHPIASATLDIGYNASFVTSGIVIVLLFIGYRIVPVGGGAPVDSGSTLISTGSWGNVNFSINVAALTPGVNYDLRIDVDALGIGFGSAYIEFNLDYSILTVTPLRPSFSGAFGHANTSIRSYNVSLYVVSMSANGNVNASIWLRNHTGSVDSTDSTEIVIINSVLISNSTNKILIDPVPTGYLALDLLIDTTLDPTADLTIDLIMRVEVEDNVYVEYPISIFIYDPPPSSNEVNYIMLENPVEQAIFAIFNKDVDIQFIFNATSS